MERIVEDLLTCVDLYGDDSEEALEVERFAVEATEKWLAAARKLEREERRPAEG